MAEDLSTSEEYKVIVPIGLEDSIIKLIENAIEKTPKRDYYSNLTVPLVATVIINKALIEYELFSYNKNFEVLLDELNIAKANKYRVNSFDNKRNEAYKRLEELNIEHEKLGFSYAILEVIRKFDLAEESKLDYLQKFYLKINSNPYVLPEVYVEAVEECIDILKQNKEDVPSWLQELKNFIIINC